MILYTLSVVHRSDLLLNTHTSRYPMLHRSPHTPITLTSRPNRAAGLTSCSAPLISLNRNVSHHLYYELNQNPLEFFVYAYIILTVHRPIDIPAFTSIGLWVYLFILVAIIEWSDI